MIIRRKPTVKLYSNTRFEYYCKEYDKWFQLHELMELPELDKGVSRARVSERLNAKWNRKISRTKSSFNNVLDCLKKDKYVVDSSFLREDNDWFELLMKMPVGSMSRMVR